jgi:hypothetical protein
VDAIGPLIAGTARAQAAIDVAAQKLASADLPTAATPDVTSPVAPDPSPNVDVAEQMTTMMAGAGTQQATTAALRAALDIYKSSVEMLLP